MSTDTEVRINKFDLTDGLLATINIGSNSYNVSIPKEDVLKILGDEPNVNTESTPVVGDTNVLQNVTENIVSDNLFQSPAPSSLLTEGNKILETLKMEIIMQISSGTSISSKQEQTDDVKNSDNYKLITKFLKDQSDDRSLKEVAEDIQQKGGALEEYDLPPNDKGFDSDNYKKYEIFVGKLKAIRVKSDFDRGSKEYNTFESVIKKSNTLLKLAIIHGFIKNIIEQSQTNREFSANKEETIKNRKKAKGEIEGIKAATKKLFNENKKDEKMTTYINLYKTNVIEKLESIEEKDNRFIGRNEHIKAGIKLVSDTIEKRIEITNNFKDLFKEKKVDQTIDVLFKNDSEDSESNIKKLNELNKFHNINGFQLIDESVFNQKKTKEISYDELIGKLKEENLHNLYLFFDGKFLEIPKLVQIVIRDDLNSNNERKTEMDILANFGLIIKVINDDKTDPYTVIFIETDEENPIEKPIEDFKEDERKKQFKKFEGTFAIPDSNSDSEEDIKSNRVLTNFRKSVESIKKNNSEDISDKVPINVKQALDVKSSDSISVEQGL